MYYVEYNNPSEKTSKAWESSDHINAFEQDLVTTKICYRPKLPNGVYSSDDFGVGNTNGFYIEILSPSWHLQKPFYWRLEPDLGSGYERIILYVDRNVKVISAAGYSTFMDLSSQDDIITCAAKRVARRNGQTPSNSELESLKSKTYYERQEILKEYFNEDVGFTGNSGQNLNSNFGADFQTRGLTTSNFELVQVKLKIHIVRLQSMRRMPIGGGSGIGSAIPSSELLWESGLIQHAIGSIDKKRIITHHFEDGSAEIVYSKEELDPDSFEFHSVRRAASIPTNWTHKCVARIRIIAPEDRFEKSGYFIETRLDNLSDSGIFIYISENSSFNIELDDNFSLMLLMIGLGKSNREKWEEFYSDFFQLKARKWIDLRTLPRMNTNIHDGIRRGTSEPWTWQSSNVKYNPISLGIQLTTDLLIGFIPIVGDALDITELVGAVFTGKDRWGVKVSGWDYVFLTMSLLPLLSGLHRRIGNRTRDLNENLARLNAIPSDVFDTLARYNVNSSEKRRLINNLFDKIFNEQPMPRSRALREDYLQNYLATGLWKKSQLELTEELFESLQIFTAVERQQLISLSGLRSDQLVNEIFS